MVVLYNHAAEVSTTYREISYNRTCLDRPYNRTYKCGLARQVISGDRFTYIKI